MATPKFHFTNLTVQTFVSSVGDYAGYPASNLNNGFVSKYWKSAANTASQYLSIDMGSTARTRTALVLDNHNLSAIMATGTMKLQSADDSAFTVNLTDVVSPLEPTAGTYVKEFATGSNRRYWRIYFNGTLNDIPYIGNLFIDLFLDFGYGYEYPFAVGDSSYETTERIALDGTIRATQPYAGRKEMELVFKLLGNTFRTAFLDFHTTVRGKLRPFYFVDTDGTTIYYVKLDSDKNPIETVGYNLNNTAKLKLKGVTVS